MLRSIALTTAVALSVAAWLLVPARDQEAAAQSGKLFIAAVEYDVVPGKVDEFLAAVTENGAASVKEPGCREFDVAVSQTDPNHVFILEVYDNEDAQKSHVTTDHFKKYKAATAGMTTKRQEQRLWSVAMNLKGK
ncbi:MAG TPA: putative quinol monooxygenase [Xanthobacteraceae bacterium]|nr:putative quinol monooxygenase [Xanthobacteraceae bacterium]